MQYDLSFWTEPDWSAESSVGTSFLCVLALVIPILLGLALGSTSLLRLMRDEALCTELEIRNARDSGAAAEVRRQESVLALWRQVEGELDGAWRRRMVLSRHLASLQALVPGSMVLERLTLDSRREEVPAPASSGGTAQRSGGRAARAPARPVFRDRYTMTISGFAFGDDAESTITVFSEELRTAGELGEALEGVELTSLTTPSRGRRSSDSDPVKQFLIACEFRAR